MQASQYFITGLKTQVCMYIRMTSKKPTLGTLAQLQMRSSLHLQIPTVQEEKNRLVETAAQHGPWREVDGPHESIKITPAHTTDNDQLCQINRTRDTEMLPERQRDVSGDVTNVTTCT